MNTQHITLVKETLVLVQPIADQVAKSFYEHLFELAPHAKKLFTGDMNKQGAMLMTSLNLAMNSIDDLKSILTSIHALGERHLSYGVKAEYYQVAIDSFLWALEHHLGEQFTPAHKEAWTQAFNSIVETMLSAYDS